MADPSATSGETLQGEERRRYVADMFARISHRYDLMNTIMTAGMHHRWRKVAAQVAARGQEGVALDLATGTGDLAFALAGPRQIRWAVGLDLVPEMLFRARKKSFAKGLEDRVRFALGDGLSLPFPDNTFACAASGWGLRNMPDLRRSLEEMVRVVVPGGRVVSLESVPVRGGPIGLPFSLFFHHIVPLMGQLIAGNRTAYTYLPRSVERFLTVDALARVFKEVGLVELGHRRMGLGAVAVHWGTKPSGLATVGGVS